MDKNTTLLIVIAVVVICVTVIASISIVSRNKTERSIWDNTPYNADVMNSLVGAFGAAAAEGGAGRSLF